jgi:hypothetical protein
MSKIFISYRRSDSEDVAGRIFDYLRQNFRRDQLFKDVDSIPPGEDFRTAITDIVQSCDVAVVIIGRGWLTATNSKGGRRLDDPDDFVRLEVEGALSRKIPVVPVLVGGAEMPPSDALPPSLQPLVFRNAVRVRPDPDFRNDVGRLVRALRGVVKRDRLIGRISRPQLITIIVFFGGALIIVPLIALYRNNGPDPTNTPTPTPAVSAASPQGSVTNQTSPGSKSPSPTPPIPDSVGEETSADDGVKVEPIEDLAVFLKTSEGEHLHYRFTVVGSKPTFTLATSRKLIISSLDFHAPPYEWEWPRSQDAVAPQQNLTLSMSFIAATECTLTIERHDRDHKVLGVLINNRYTSRNPGETYHQTLSVTSN